MRFILHPRLSTSQLVSHIGVTAGWKWLWLAQGSLMPPPTQVTASTPVSKAWQMCLIQGAQQRIVLSCQLFSSVPNTMEMWMLQEETGQEWGTPEISKFLRRPSQRWIEGKWCDSILSREEIKNTPKWSLNKDHVSSRPKPTLNFLTERAVTKKESGMRVAFWETPFSGDTTYITVPNEVQLKDVKIIQQ